MEAGTPAGTSPSAWPSLAFAADGWTHVAWGDHRDGYHSIRASSAFGLVDDDGDNWFGPGNDCNDGDATAWSKPGEAIALQFSDAVSLVWTPPAAPGGTSPRYDSVRSTSRSDFVTGAICLETDGIDTSSIESATPAPGQVFYYLIRAENSCGDGSLGTNSGGSERTARICP